MEIKKIIRKSMVDVGCLSGIVALLYSESSSATLALLSFLPATYFLIHLSYMVYHCFKKEEK